MHIELLHDFIVLAEELNYRSAAKRLFTTPSTLSKHIMTLEEHYGAKLFNRDKSSVALTNKGALLLGGAQKVWSEYQRTLDLLSKDAEATTLYLSGTLDNPEDYPLVSQAISRFKAATGCNPHLLPCKSVFAAEQVALLHAGEADCAIFYVSRNAFEQLENCEDIEHRVVGNTPLDLLVSENNALASKQVATLADFEGKTLIQLVGPRLTPTWLQIKEQLDAAGVHFATTLYPASTPYDYFNLDPKDNLFLLPRLFDGTVSNQHPGCVRVPVDSAQLTLTLAALVPTGPKREMTLAFLDALSDCMQHAYA